MKEGIKCLYVSFDSSALETREKVSFDADELREFLRVLKDGNFSQEFFLLSTCNRTEIYYYSADDLRDEFVRLLCRYKALDVQEIVQHVHSELNGPNAVDRLFRIANGMMSQVVGDFQIIRQLKNAYEIAIEVRTVGSYLHRLLQLVFASHKDVSTSTKIHSGNSSVASVAAELVQRFAHRLPDPRLLIVGAGSFSREILIHLEKRGFSKVTIANRNIEKAKQLSAAFGAKWIGLESIESLDEYDVVITCIFTHGHVIDRRHFTGNQERKLLIDLSVPRAIHPQTGEISTVTLKNMDQIGEENSKALQVRKDSIPHAIRIIETYCEEFKTWELASPARPVLTTLKSTMEKIRADEVSRFLKKSRGSKADAELIETITKSIVNKILRTPAVRLSDSIAGKDLEAERLSEALVRLFDLEMPVKINERH